MSKCVKSLRQLLDKPVRVCVMQELCLRAPFVRLPVRGDVYDVCIRSVWYRGSIELSMSPCSSSVCVGVWPQNTRAYLKSFDVSSSRALV